MRGSEGEVGRQRGREGREQGKSVQAGGRQACGVQ